MKRSIWIGMAATITIKTVTISTSPAHAEALVNEARARAAAITQSKDKRHAGGSALVDLSNAPLSPSELTPGKIEDAATLLLRAAARENVTKLDEFSALIERQKARDAALMELIGPDSPLTHAFAHALEKNFGDFFAPHVAPENQHAVAMQMVQSIFLNRRDDLASVQTLYGDDQWRQEVRARLQKGEAPALNVALNDEKLAELKNTALYVHTPGKPEGKIEPAVHSQLTALAHHIGHAALADLFRADSEIHAKFQETLKAKLPNDPAAKQWLDDWMILRADRAEAVVKAFRPDGELMQKAIEESETKRRSRLKNPPAIIRAPAEANGNNRVEAPVAQPTATVSDAQPEMIGKHAQTLIAQLTKDADSERRR